MLEKRVRLFFTAGKVREFLGVWPTEREARIAYDRAALHFAVDRKRLRIPEVSLALGPATPEELRRVGRLRTNSLRKASKYTGVTFDRDARVWLATIRDEERKSYGLGRFEEEQQAARVYDQAALYLFGKRARLNFPRKLTKERAPEEIQAELVRQRNAARSSRYRGISFEKIHQTRPWSSYLTANRCWHYCGNWKTEREAAIARDRAILALRLPRARMNFPELARTLRSASPEELREEARVVRKLTATSKYRGVTFHSSGTWAARIMYGGRNVHIGVFQSEESAARAFDEAAKRFRGAKAKLNFPD